MAAWFSGLSARDSALLFAQMMGFVKNVDDEVDYFQLEKALDYYGQTGCTYELKRSDDGSSKVGYRIGDRFQVIFTTCYDDAQFGRYPEAKTLQIMVVDQQPYNARKVKATSKEMAFRPGRHFRCNALGGVMLSSDQVSYIMCTLSNLKEAVDEWNYYLESF